MKPRNLETIAIMTAKEAKQTAAARGFQSVWHWMDENRKGRQALALRPASDTRDAAIRALDNERERFYKFA